MERLSPDGMYYWDGRSWMSTLSPDGRFRWDGAAWRPVTTVGFGPGYQPARLPTRVPTSWTRPLQLGVAGWYAWSALYALALPLVMQAPLSQYITQSMNQSLQRQAELYPSASPLPPGLTTLNTDFVNSMVTFGLWFGVVFSLAISTVAIVGAVRRWTWLYYVVLVLLGLTLVSLPIDLINLATGSAVSSFSGVSMNMPSWFLWVGTIVSVPAVVLFVCMLVAVIRRGPWGMRRPGD